MKSMTKLAALGVVAALALVGCGSASNLEGKSDNSGGSSDILVVGSQEYYSNEILAEIYAQSLEKAGHKVDRQLNIGQREVYMPDLQAGKIRRVPRVQRKPAAVLQVRHHRPYAGAGQHRALKCLAKGAQGPRSGCRNRPGLLRGDQSIRRGTLTQADRRPGRDT